MGIMGLCHHVQLMMSFFKAHMKMPKQNYKVSEKSNESDDVANACDPSTIEAEVRDS